MSSFLPHLEAGWIELVGSWLWNQSLSVLPVFVVVLLLARLRLGRDPRMRTLLWGAVLARLVLPGQKVSLESLLLPGVDSIEAYPFAFDAAAQSLSTTLSPRSEAAYQLLPEAGWPVLIWASVVLLLMIHWGRARWSYSEFLRGASSIEDPEIESLSDRWRSAYGIRRTVRLVTRRSSFGPFTVGLLRPVIYLPHQVLEGSRDAVEAVLAHELAHVKAWDDGKIFLQRIVTTLFFFHPMAWFGARQLNESRELARDRDVLAQQLLGFREYGRGMVDAVRVSVVEPAGLAALGKLFPRRIGALIEAGQGPSKDRHWNLWPKVFLFLGLLALPVVTVSESMAALESSPLLGLSHDSSQEPTAAKTPIDWQSPLPDGRQSSGFGQRRNPFTGEMNFHRGVDLVDREGAAVLAPAAGRVLVATEDPENPDWGTTLLLEHDHGYQSFFAHLDALEVEVGQMVKKGQVVARVGQTGKVTGVHLHFEIRSGEELVDVSELIDGL